MATFNRYLFSELLGISRGITFNKIYQGTHNVQVARTLYTAEALGVDKYIRMREKLVVQLSDITDSFRSKMNQVIEPDSKHMIFTEDLKNMLHMVQPGNKKDLDLVVNMIKRYNEQTKEMRFGSYTFGPVIMRMLHFLNEPSVALEVYKNPELSGFFDQVTSCHVCMNLLYKNQKYQEVLDVLDLIKTKQMQDAKFPRNAVLLALAACYKMNTPESLKYTLDLWKQLQEVGHVPMRRATTFAAALALNQNSPQIALEIVSTIGQPNYVTVRNIKLAALADVGRPEDTFPILRNLIEKEQDPNEVKNTITKDVCEKIRASVATSGNQDSIREFEELEKHLIQSGNVTESISLDDLLTKEVGANKGHTKGHNRQIMEASYSRQSQRKSSFNRPGLRDLD